MRSWSVLSYLISDVAYLDCDSYNVHQPAAWIPLLDSNKKNGCMEVYEHEMTHNYDIVCNTCI